jgi:hypothetical protein
MLNTLKLKLGMRLGIKGLITNFKARIIFFQLLYKPMTLGDIYSPKAKVRY